MFVKGFLCTGRGCRLTALDFAVTGFFLTGPRRRDAATAAPAVAPSGPAMAPPMMAPTTARNTRRRPRRLICSFV